MAFVGFSRYPSGGERAATYQGIAALIVGAGLMLSAPTLAVSSYRRRRAGVALSIVALVLGGIVLAAGWAFLFDRVVWSPPWTIPGPWALALMWPALIAVGVYHVTVGIGFLLPELESPRLTGEIVAGIAFLGVGVLVAIPHFAYILGTSLWVAAAAQAWRTAILARWLPRTTWRA